MISYLVCSENVEYIYKRKRKRKKIERNTLIIKPVGQINLSLYKWLGIRGIGAGHNPYIYNVFYVT